MSKRTKTATVDIGLRVKEPLRARIERAAKDSGVSMNAEINGRLETTFTKEHLFDDLFGGPEMRRLAVMWAAVFAYDAQAGQYLQHGTPIGSPVDKKDLTDPASGAYRHGALAVVEALMKGMPDEAKALFLESLRSRVVTGIINRPRKAKGGAGQ